MGLKLDPQNIATASEEELKVLKSYLSRSRLVGNIPNIDNLKKIVDERLVGFPKK